MYPGTIARWHDLSAIQTETTIESLENIPLYTMCSSFDRGPEDMRIVSGRNFYNLYGSRMNFAKHGQPALQAANIIDGGGSILIKRLVADDALLANTVVCTSVVKGRTARVAGENDTDVLTYDEAMAVLSNRTTLEEALENHTPAPTVHILTEAEKAPADSYNLEALVITAQSDSDTTTSLTINPEPGEGNVYLYAVTDASPVYIPYNDPVTIGADPGFYTLLTNITDPVTVTHHNAVITVVEATVEVPDPEQHPEQIIYHAVKMGAVNAVCVVDTTYVVEDPATALKWTTVSVTGCKTHEEVFAEAEKCYANVDISVTENEDDGSLAASSSITYPLFSISDNGRGTSNKTVKFETDFTTSKDMSNMFYTISVYDSTTRLERISASLNPYCIVNNVAYGISNDLSDQVIFDFNEARYSEFIANVCDALNITEDTAKKYDLIFGTTNRGAKITGLAIDPESVDLGSTYGIELQNGDNGEFGDAPFGTEPYIESAVQFFSGEYDDAIWDVDQFKIAAVFDANYPDAVKTAIAHFVSFREDCVFFRDLGTDIYSYSSIVEKVNNLKLNAELDDESEKFVADYLTTYEIYDPETRKRIRVTSMYDFARTMINHFSSGPYRPTAGIINSMILTNAIDGTVNFTPRVTPSVNQKSLLDDMRINYAIFQNGQCVVQSLYTSQDSFTQLSYVNNVLGIQDVLRAVRVSCPQQRYTFSDTGDFSDYATAVNNVLKEYKSNFDELTFEYTQDNLQTAQKIFYASIYFRFKNWAQTEHFDLYALPIGTEE